MNILSNKKVTVDDIKEKISNLSLNEHCNSFVSIVDMIFYVDGVDKYWDILSKRSGKDDYEKILEFLSPDGQFFNLLLKEMPTDKSMISYQFPINRLSPHTQRDIANNSATAFILSRLHSKVHTPNNSFIFLNAFEYYMFSFFGYIYNPLVAKRIDWNGSTDSIYCQLVFRYLDMFLFNNHHSRTLMQLFIYSRNKSSFNHTSIRSPNHSFNSFTASSPFNESIFGRNRFMSKNNKSVDIAELYYTETIVQVINEYWLNFQVESNICGNSSLKISQTIMTNSCLHPSVDHVCLVRIFLKHVYHFCYATCISHISPVSQIECEFMAKLNFYRQEVLPRFIISRIYSYLDYCFFVWPVDLSFKIVLETWLSAIQPWRYADTAHHLSDHDNSSMIVIDDWHSFIKENTDIYCQLLLSFIRRMSKTDLSVLRNAQMLFRVAKVIHQSNVGSFIDLSCMMRSQQQAEFVWSEIQSQVFLVFTDIDQILSRLQTEKETVSKSWLRSLWDSVNSDFLSDNNTSKRLSTYLTQSQSLLTSAMKMDYTMNGSRMSHDRNDYQDFRHTQPEHVVTYKGVQLTDFGRYQVSHGLCKLDMNQSQVDYYQRPVCSYEVVSLLIMCRRLSGFVSSQFQDYLNDACLRLDFLGRVARFLFIHQRMPIISADSSKDQETNNVQQWISTHTPQIRIRFLASKVFWFWFMLIFLIAYLSFDVGVSTMIIGSSLLYLLVAVVYVALSGFS